MKYKLIASDVDGTLLNTNNELPDSAKKAIGECNKSGIRFTLSTGRPIQGIRRFAELFTDDIPVITYNGAVVLTYKSERVVFSCVLTPESCRSIYNAGKNMGVTQIVWANNRLFTDKINDASLKYRTLSDEPLNEITDFDETVRTGAAKILWIAPREDMPGIEKRTPEVLSDVSGIRFCTSKPEFLEFVNADVSKATALAAVCEYLGISKDEAVAIGDGFNDLPMLEYAGLGIAMGNAPDEVKKKCGYVTAHVDSDGFAKALRSLV